jgi:hypothetical protein
LGTIILVTVITPDMGEGEGVVEDVEDVCDDDAEEVADVVVDALGKPAGEGVDVVAEEREARGGGLAEAVRGGNIVE